jgi:hypothetical protein
MLSSLNVYSVQIHNETRNYMVTIPKTLSLKITMNPNIASNPSAAFTKKTLQLRIHEGLVSQYSLNIYKGKVTYAMRLSFHQDHANNMLLGYFGPFGLNFLTQMNAYIEIIISKYHKETKFKDKKI